MALVTSSQPAAVELIPVHRVLAGSRGTPTSLPPLDIINEKLLPLAVRPACHAHARRYIFEAREHHPQQTAQLLAWYRRLLSRVRLSRAVRRPVEGSASRPIRPNTRAATRNVRWHICVPQRGCPWRSTIVPPSRRRNDERGPGSREANEHTLNATCGPQGRSVQTVARLGHQPEYAQRGRVWRRGAAKPDKSGFAGTTARPANGPQRSLALEESKKFRRSPSSDRGSRFGSCH